MTLDVENAEGLKMEKLITKISMENNRRENVFEDYSPPPSLGKS